MKIIVDELPRYGEKCPFDYQDSWGYSLCNKKDCPLKEKYRHCTLSECDKLIAFNKFIKRSGI